MADDIGRWLERLGLSIYHEAFRANDVVRQGQPLVQIDDAVESADLIAAEAAVARDRAQSERAQTLSRRGVSSEATLEDAQKPRAVANRLFGEVMLEF